VSSAAARAEPRIKRAPRHTAQPAVRPRSRPRPAARPRVAGGVLWIVIVAVLLAGIVALNVAVLGLNMEVERLDTQKERIQSQTAEIATELSSAAASGRVEAAARGRLGLVDATQTTYVQVSRRGR
jgi:cell division protein FtsL